jgi:hypothetical protein
MALGRKAKRRIKEVAARGNSYVESTESKEAKDDKEDDEPIATLASKKKKLKTAHKPNPIQDKMQCPDPVHDGSLVQDVSRRTDNKSDDKEESSIDNKSKSEDKDEPIEDLSCPQDNESEEEDDDKSKSKDKDEPIEDLSSPQDNKSKEEDDDDSETAAVGTAPEATLNESIIIRPAPLS